jgi:hypothetical protein
MIANPIVGAWQNWRNREASNEETLWQNKGRNFYVLKLLYPSNKQSNNIVTTIACQSYKQPKGGLN